MIRKYIQAIAIRDYFVYEPTIAQSNSNALNFNYKNFYKPCIDNVVSIFLLLLLTPIFLIVSILLAFSNGGNPFFVQPRPGKNGKIFKIIKFRTMSNKRNQYGQLCPDYERLTPIGRIIRITSLDELPQLINVLKGEMSLVGPRPLLVDYLPLYNSNQRQRHDVKPGITGWAQINGRNSLSWEEKFNYDLEYVQKYNLRMDLKIVIITLKKIARRNGVNANNFITAESFKGNLV